MAESGGRWAARTTGREMPRQNGKGDELEVVELWGIAQRGESILHTAHELTTVSSAHGRMVSLIEGHADLRRMKVKILNGIGQQLIEVKNKTTGLTGVIAYRTRTNGGGRGLDDISRLVVDEAQHAKPEQLASSTPILLANPNPQTNFAGTGAIDGVSDWWWELRKRALGKNPGAFGYVGHTAEKVSVDDAGNVTQVPIDPSDRQNWYDANPALHNDRGEVEFFEEQLRTLGPALFAREHLGVWDSPGGAGQRVVSQDVWRLACDDVIPPRIREAQQVVSWDVSPNRSKASIGFVALRADGLWHQEIVQQFDGTDGVARRVVQYVANAGSVVIGVAVVKGSPAYALIEDVRIELKAVGVSLEVTELSSQEYAAGCGSWLDKVNAGTLRRVASAPLDAAVDGVVLRDVGDVKVWDRKNATADITPLCAVTVALRAIETMPPKVNDRPVFWA